ncbi:hypothetical protein STEG23_028168, partial [Scotinomys teguina]
MEMKAAAPRCQLLLILLMSVVMLLPGTNGSLLLVQRTVTRTILLQETIGKAVANELAVINMILKLVKLKLVGTLDAGQMELRNEWIVVHPSTVSEISANCSDWLIDKAVLPVERQNKVGQYINTGERRKESGADAASRLQE